MIHDDELKRAWQSQFRGRRLVFNEDLILRQFRRQQSELRGELYGADVLMVLIACAVLGIMGYAFYLSRWAAWAQWAVLIMVLPIAGFAAFTIVDRIRHLRRHPKRDDSVKACLESMLAEVHHRTWLYKNVLWWFVLPVIVLADGGFHAYVLWRAGWMTGAGKDAVVGVLRALAESAITAAAAYYIFRWTITKHCEPYRQELEALLQNLRHDNRKLNESDHLNSAS
jgi:hypothetical protein